MEKYLPSSGKTIVSSPLGSNILIQTIRAYFQYIDITFKIESVHMFHNDINDQHGPDFHLRFHTTFFIDKYYDSNVLNVMSL